MAQSRFEKTQVVDLLESKKRGREPELPLGRLTTISIGP